MVRYDWARLSGGCVSILARPVGRAQPRSGGWDRVPASRFNPRPPRRTGATSPPFRSGRTVHRFNPRPPRRTGATSTALPASRLVRKVSILARPVGRAQPTTLETFNARRQGFNPRPPRRTGATGERHAVVGVVPVVSILARPVGRAQLPAGMVTEPPVKVFQSSPAP